MENKAYVLSVNHVNAKKEEVENFVDVNTLTVENVKHTKVRTIHGKLAGDFHAIKGEHHEDDALD